MTPYYQDDAVTIYHGDNLPILQSLADCSVDAIVTDPPYGLAFMGKRWDYDVPSVELWAECLRVLKPGGHLLAFAGTRTQHRMAVRIEDAGFEIRDMIAWVYGSGFPKSLDVSKAIDKAAGAEREVVGSRVKSGDIKGGSLHSGADSAGTGYQTVVDITAPATEAARQWQGYGTALKPSLETVTFASKPLPCLELRRIIQLNLFQLETKLWLLLNASAAESNSKSSLRDFKEALSIVQWTADKLTSIRGGLLGQMDTSLFELATNTSLSIVSSWRSISEECFSDTSTFTTGTKSNTTTDWRTLKFSLSQITPESIIKACSLPGGFSANATTAESHFNASLSLLRSIHTLSATEPAISREAHDCQGEGVKPNLDPCVMARKPIIGTVAANVLEHGTGALNVDGCRVGTEDVSSYAIRKPGTLKHGGTNHRPHHDNESTPTIHGSTSGRWPANLIHDGSDEVVELFPETGVSSGRDSRGRNHQAFTDDARQSVRDDVHEGFGDTGSAARFFYCAKADATERRGSKHPTVKPLALMRYLVRMVTPIGSTVLDPFMGSGTTIEAARLESCKSIGMERESEHCADAAKRLSQGVLF